MTHDATFTEHDLTGCHGLNPDAPHIVSRWGLFGQITETHPSKAAAITRALALVDDGWDRASVTDRDAGLPIGYAMRPDAEEEMPESSETDDDQNRDVIVWTHIAGSWSNATGVRSRADVDYLISCWTDRGLRPFGGNIYRIIHASEGPPKPLGDGTRTLPEPRQEVTPAGTAYLLPGIEPAPVAQKGGGYQGRMF